MFASTILSIVVLAVISAMSAAQMQSFEGQKAILAAIAANNHLSELVTLDYADLRAKDGQIENVGALVSIDGVAYPDPFWALGRDVLVKEIVQTVAELSVEITGLRVVVIVRDDARVLAEIETFVPEPVL
ncbi:hypothetical protein JYT11_00780 [Planctomycetaceae bacterium AH-315-I19]|nr:hypothetical protein [Planctomycetaceae bacterium AH-315-I19]